MRDLARAIEGLQADLAAVQREVFILERALQELAPIFDRYAGPNADVAIQAHLDAIVERMATALARQASIAQLMEECGRERRRARFMRRISLNGTVRGRWSFARPFAGRAKSP
jgi:hypothetical protein